MFLSICGYELLPSDHNDSYSSDKNEEIFHPFYILTQTPSGSFYDALGGPVVLGTVPSVCSGALSGRLSWLCGLMNNKANTLLLASQERHTDFGDIPRSKPDYIRTVPPNEGAGVPDR